jgi:uncharacterized protein (UPF0335 family)
MMVAATVDRLHFSVYCVSQLLTSGDGSKVEESYDATRAISCAGRRTPEVKVTSRLRELIQQLGEAIHESVIESEQIAGVVQDIRKHGFDVLLMLEATIGLNEVTAKDAKDSDESDGGSSAVGSATSFTPNDLHFLRRLRISVEGEEKDGVNADTE